MINAILGDSTANSYVNISEANEYFFARLNSIAWTNCDDIVKEQALRTSTKTINYQKFYGDKSVTNQPLSFPRKGLPVVDGVDINNIIPNRLKDATCELAIYMLQNHTSNSKVNDVRIKKEKIGEIETEYYFSDNENKHTSNNDLPAIVSSLLQEFTQLSSNGSNVYQMYMGR